MFENILPWVQDHGKLLVFLGVVFWFLFANREFLRSRLPIFFQRKSVGPGTGIINEALLESNSRQQSFYYLERLRDYATELNSVESLKTLDVLQANLFNLPNPKP